MFPDPLISVRLWENSSISPRHLHPRSWYSEEVKMVINDSFIYLFYRFVKQLSTTTRVGCVLWSALVSRPNKLATVHLKCYCCSLANKVKEEHL